MKNQNLKRGILGMSLVGILGYIALADQQGIVTQRENVFPNQNYQKTTFQVVVNNVIAYCADKSQPMQSDDLTQRPWNLQVGDRVTLPIEGMYTCDLLLPGQYDVQKEQDR
ncbi:hypothetical protein HYV86_07245 [Candidatus Woesearchaeota archaeon]|nr:hypothetical protein [Candidatus Woesearchaeota archaeon]